MLQTYKSKHALKREMPTDKRKTDSYSRVSWTGFVLFCITQSTVYTACNVSAPCHMTPETERATGEGLSFIPGITEKGLRFLSDINSAENDYLSDTAGYINTTQTAEHTIVSNAQPLLSSDVWTTTKGSQQDSTFRPIMAEEPSAEYLDTRALQSPTSVMAQDNNDWTSATRLVKSLQTEPCAGPLAEIYSEIVSKLVYPRPNAEIFFVEDTGVLVDQLISIIPARGQSYEDTVKYLSNLAFLSQSEACITHLQLSPKNTFFQQDMQDFLNKKGECDDAYSSEVRIFEVQRNDIHQPSENWVVKVAPMPEEGSNGQYRHSWRSLLGELLAYELSQRLGLGLVPETQLILLQDTHGIRLGTTKPLMPNLSQEYEGATGHTWNHKVQAAKAFTFIMGQWDLRLGNISMDANGNPILIDNECIIHFEGSEVLRVNDYRRLRTQKPFMYIDTVAEGETSDSGSQDRPLRLDNSQLARLMGQDIADNPWWLSKEDETCEVIVQEGKVYKHFPTAQTLYMPYCYRDVIAKFDRLNSDFVLEAGKSVMNKIDFTLHALKRMCLSTSGKRIPSIDDWLKISSNLEKRVQGLAAGVGHRKASFCTFHNYTP